MPAFDPARGGIGAFANIVLRNQSSRIAIRHHQQRRAQGGTILSLEVPLAGETDPVGATLTEADGLAAWHGQDRTALDDSDDRHALETALKLPKRLDLARDAARAHEAVPGLIVANWVETR